MSVLDVLGHSVSGPLAGMRASELADDILRAQRALAERPPMTLAAWTRRYGEARSPRGGVVRRGGISDDRGELGDLQDNARGFARLTNRRSGFALDDVANAAWERGYFPDSADRPSLNAFLDALREDVRGNAIVAADDLDALASREDAGRFLGDLDSVGVDVGLRRRQALVEELRRHGALSLLLGSLGGAGVLAAINQHARGGAA